METVLLYLSLARSVNLAAYGCLGAVEASSRKEAHRNEGLVYLFIAGIFTGMTAGAWYALAFVVCPLG